MTVVEAVNLVKIYDTGKKAVDGISFSLKEGEIFGFLGPNGAGKTTTMRLLTGMISATEGRCRVFDIDPLLNPVEVHQFSGIITEHAQMYDELTGLQNLVFYGRMFGFGRKEAKDAALLLLEQLGLSSSKDQKLSTYSTGMRQRLSLARTIIHRPKILFLDEPTAGLDPESVQSVNNLIKNLSIEKGVTVFLCTHQLRYAQEICDTYGLIDNGRLLAVGDIDYLHSLVSSGETAVIESTGIPTDITSDKIGENTYAIKIKSGNDVSDIVRRIVESGYNVFHVSVKQRSLEEIYFSLIDSQYVTR